ncbi:hypothetical protein [Mycobacterium paraintracellulare]|uniref:hypothetical protein n=1 Tax=Mycobacterium paraintracellulare TaxID=1138383 RepID=UPI001916C937|nr:hypothetical protein [Mycobacterium paraintracellulare]BCP06107.1 hypothetical protein MINTM019_35630 [Mycobacterium paraintracellulare]
MTDKDDVHQPEADDTEMIEGFYDWGPGVVVTADCLGRAYQTALAGRQLVVTLPSFDGTTVAEPPLRYKRPDHWVNVDPPNPWGELRSWNNAEDGSQIPVTVCIKRVRILLFANRVESDDPNFGPQLDDLLSPWWDTLSSWIEVVTGQDLARLGERRPKQPQTFHLWGGNADGTMRPLAMMFRANFFPQAPALNSFGLLGCLSAVARGQSAPPERLHLSDARSLHNDGQWRRAVIDAATAAEVAITSWLDNRLSTAEFAVKAALLNTPLTLGRLHRLYTQLGGVLPQDFDNLVVKPRNDAAHRGMSLTLEQSAAAINATAQLLDATTPIAV